MDDQATSESERLFLLTYDENNAILLQQKDLVEGEEDEFIPFVNRLTCV